MGTDPGRRTLASRLEDRDRGRFVGREPELIFLERCLGEDPLASVVHVSGPGGIGKSALLRELARRARDQGFQVVAIDGREVGPTSVTLDAALREATSCARPLLLIDSYERMTALDSYLRRDVVRALPERALVVIAGRAAPDPAWFTGGWETVTARLQLSSMSARDAHSLLAASGLSDERVPSIIEWAGGSPLALSLAADAAQADSEWSAASDPDRPEILQSLIHRLVDSELPDARLPALCIAAVARTTTPQLLRAVLPRSDADAAYQQLCDLTVSEPLGEGITLHELVRKALAADLKLRSQELERDLRRRIIDYLYACASDGEPMLMIEMAHLVEDPLVRWGFGWEGGADLRIDSIRPGDTDRVQSQLGAGNWQWWEMSRRFFEQAPDRVAVARDASDQVRGYMAYMSQVTAPAFADADPIVGPWLARARADAALGDSVLWHAAVDFTGQGKVQAMLGIAGVLRSGVANPRFAYLPIDPRVPGAIGFAQALGARHLAELDAVVGGMIVECHRLDCGPGGMLASLRAQVYRELGLQALTVPEQAMPVLPRPLDPSSDDLEAVRAALRSFRVPRDLARSPLARGDTMQERADFVRRLLREAASEAFGDNDTEKLLHAVLVAGYLEPDRSHEAAAARLCLSRAAYFRRLRVAVERLAEYMAASASTPDPVR